MLKKVSRSLILLLLVFSAYGQNDTLNVLFLGNSYTGANNLPQITASLANAAGKTLNISSHTPGGNTMEGHSTNTVSQNRIKQGNWDYVVLQEQSQIPTIDFYRYNSMYPGIQRLNDSIKKYNPCAKVVMYMTWGRRFGGQQCDPNGVHCSPVFTDFTHMQDSLESAYTEIANDIKAYIAPVGIAWKNVLADTSIVLHTADNSHPNYSGSYLAACVFHSILWEESPVGISFTGSISSGRATFLQKMADSTVFFSNDDWNMNIDSVYANYSYTISNDTVHFTNLSTNRNPSTYLWDFGDGNTSADINPIHVYSIAQTYNVSLITEHCTVADTIAKLVTIIPVNLTEPKLQASVRLFPNPVHSELEIIIGDRSSEVTVRIVHSIGQNILSLESRNEKSIRLNTDTWKSGLYKIYLHDMKNEEQAVFKVLKR